MLTVIFVNRQNKDRSKTILMGFLNVGQMLFDLPCVLA